MKDGSMKKLIGILVIWMVSLQAVEIPEEDDISISSLNNGIQVWLKNHSYPENTVACRIVARRSEEELPQIFTLDCPTEVLEEELPSFIEYCYDSIEDEATCKMSMVAVGDFDKDDLTDFLAKAFAVFSHRREGIESPQISISESLIDDKMVYVSLHYPTPFPPLNSDKNLKELWSIYLLQIMAQDRFHKMFALAETDWIKPTDARYLLPMSYCVARGKRFVGKENEIGSESLRMLERPLLAMQEIKSEGFKMKELAEAKGKLQKNLLKFYQRSPDNGTLADYFASHCSLGQGCPSYTAFMAMSLHVISEIEIFDIYNLFGAYFRDDLRRVEIVATPSTHVDELDVQKLLNAFQSDTLIVNREVVEEEMAKDAYSQLLITDEEIQIIYEIIDTIAKSNVAKLLVNQSEMEEKGRKISQVHPMKFLGVVFSNPHLKKCMAKIHDGAFLNSFKWSGFFDGSSNQKGFAQKMDEEAKKNNLLKYVPGFAKAVKASPDQIRVFILKKEWEKLVKYLIKLDS